MMKEIRKIVKQKSNSGGHISMPQAYVGKSVRIIVEETDLYSWNNLISFDELRKSVSLQPPLQKYDIAFRDEAYVCINRIEENKDSFDAYDLRKVFNYIKTCDPDLRVKIQKLSKLYNIY